MRFKSIAAVTIAASLVVVASIIPVRTEAQSIAQRVRSAGDGRVRFTFAPKPDICGYGGSISRNGGSNRWGSSSNDSPDVEYGNECGSSPVRVILYVDNGGVTKVRTYVGGRWRPGTDITDLGHVSTRDATAYLLDLAANGPTASVSRDAIMPATLADSVTIWPALTRIARDESRPNSTRKQALFWLSTEAGDHIAGRDKGIKDPDSEIKKQAVFALSQRMNGESVPALMQVARNNRDPEVRRSALFWLGQTSDPRVVSFFEEILSR